MDANVAGQEWLTAPATRAVISALERAGGEGCARFVGGSVRNALMGQPVADVDIATILTPERVMEALAAAGLKSVPTGLDHGTVTAISEHRPFEITTLRRDVSTDGRNATVAFTDDWALDARRRDFTFNALYADSHGQVFDPVGQGVADALAGRAVFVGDARTRIREDYLRILRFFRFHAWYGRGEPDAAALEACAALKDGMARLSAERIAKELLKLLEAPDPAPAVALMRRTGVLAVFLPEAEDEARLARVAGLSGDPVLRLAALLPDDRVLAGGIATRLRLSNAQRDRLAQALSLDPVVTPGLGERAARRALYELGAEGFIDRLSLSGGDERLAALAAAWERPALPVAGADAAALGLPRGPQIGEALRKVEAWWIENDFPPDRRAALKVLSDVSGV